MEICLADLVALVDQTWQVMFGEELQPVDTTARKRDVIRASVEICGCWNGSLVVEFDPAGAEQVACRLLEAKPGELEISEIHDATGEVANILAGNLKSMLPQPSVLGLPCVKIGEFDGSPDTDLEERLQVSLRWIDTDVSVMILEFSDPRG